MDSIAIVHAMGSMMGGGGIGGIGTMTAWPVPGTGGSVIQQPEGRAMSTDVAALVRGASALPPGLEGLWDLYNTFVSRSLRERRRAHKLFAAVKAENVVDTRALFALPGAWAGNGMPALALVPYRSQQVLYSAFATEGQGWFHVSDNSRGFLQIRGQRGIMRSVSNASARVPLVPKSLAPRNPLTKHKTYVLFDANWEIPRVEDPYLLERVSDNQFKVLGHWDLTDKERELMRLLNA